MVRLLQEDAARRAVRVGEEEATNNCVGSLGVERLLDLCELLLAERLLERVVERLLELLLWSSVGAAGGAALVRGVQLRRRHVGNCGNAAPRCAAAARCAAGREERRQHRAGRRQPANWGPCPESCASADRLRRRRTVRPGARCHPRRRPLPAGVLGGGGGGTGDASGICRRLRGAEEEYRSVADLLLFSAGKYRACP